MHFSPACRILQLALLMSFTHRWMRLSFSLLFGIVGSAVLSASSLLCFQQASQGLSLPWTWGGLMWVLPFPTHPPHLLLSSKYQALLWHCRHIPLALQDAVECTWKSSSDHLPAGIRLSVSGDLMGRTHCSSLSLDRAVPDPDTSWLGKSVCLSSKGWTQPSWGCLKVVPTET